MNAHWSYEFAWAALDSQRPTLVTVRDHAWAILRYSPDAYRVMRLLMNAIVLRRARCLTANSAYLRERLPQRLQSSTVVIPNFYVESEWSAWQRPVAKTRTILTVANGFARRKNVHAALRAFALVRLRHPDMEYRLIGDDMGPGETAARFAEAEGLHAGVTFVGRQPYERTIEEIRRAMILLHPALEESFGMTILEAMVVGTTVVAGQNSGNVPFLLGSGAAGFVCDVRDPPAIAGAVQGALADPEDMGRRVSRARAIASEQYSDTVALERYEERLMAAACQGNGA